MLLIYMGNEKSVSSIVKEAKKRMSCCRRKEQVGSKHQTKNICILLCQPRIYVCLIFIIK